MYCVSKHNKKLCRFRPYRHYHTVAPTRAANRAVPRHDLRLVATSSTASAVDEGASSAFAEMAYRDLQRELKARGLRAVGKRDEVVGRSSVVLQPPSRFSPTSSMSVFFGGRGSFEVIELAISQTKKHLKKSFSQPLWIKRQSAVRWRRRSWRQLRSTKRSFCPRSW